MAKNEEKKLLTKAELEREKLALENIKLRRETTKNLWWYLGRARAIIPIATLIVTVVVLYNQTRTEKRRVESETANQLAATVKDLDSSKTHSIRLGAVLSMENFIPLGEEYRGQLYLLLGNLLREEAKKTPRDLIMIHHVCESFRKLSKVRLARNDAAISLYLINAKLDRLSLHLFDLRGAELREANLEGAILREAHLDSAKFWKANLSVANLERAVLTKADLQEANLEGAYLRGANLNQKPDT
jgi:hypothetical protein